jgi:AcrR family transcriptional regulator
MATTDELTGTSPGRRRRSPRADAQRNYQVLLAAAAKVFADEGPHASMHGIARQAGVGIGTLYRHFPTREDLLGAVFLSRMESLRTEAEALADHRSPVGGLTQWLRCHIESGRGGQSLAASVIAAQLDGAKDPGGGCAAMAAAGQVLLDRAVAAGEVRAEIQLYDLIKMAQAIVLVAETAQKRDELAERMLNLLIRGVRPDSACR